MAIGLMKLNDALVAAGAPEDKARAAAEEVASYENRLAGIEATQKLHSWMLGTNVALTLAVLGFLLRGVGHG
jgi:hypothetical protein